MTPPPFEIPAVLTRHIEHGLGEAGAAWLRDLPTIAANLADRWGVTLGEPFELSFNYVCRATRYDGTEAVLKIGPWGREMVLEIAALRHYDGVGICRLLESDLDLGALLIERLRPGEILLDTAAHDDDAATIIGAQVMSDLWRPLESIPDPSQFRPLAEWFEAFPRHRAFYGGPGPFDPAVLERAEAITRDLLVTVPRTVLLHGDLHHYNILTAKRAPWLAIDPKGMLGDPGYEVGPFLLNPQGPPKPADLLRRRLDIFADALSYDWERLRAWSIAHAVLSACWSAENFGRGWEDAMTEAATLIGL